MVIKIFYVFFPKLYIVLPSILVYDLFWVHFCFRCKLRFVFLTQACPTVPTRCVGRTLFTELCLHLYQWSIGHISVGSVFRLSSLFHWRMYLSFCQFHTVLILTPLASSLKIRMWESINSVLFKIILVVLFHLLFHTNFRANFFVSIKNHPGTLHVDYVNIDYL